MSSLDWTISFVQMNIIFHHITENLNFNVTWLCYIFFDQNSIITEWLQWFSFTGFKSFKELLFSSDDSHTLSSTSWDCFNQDRPSDFFSLFEQILSVLILLMVSWYDRNVCCSHDFLAFTLASHWDDSWGWGTNKLDTTFNALFSEFSILW